MQQGHREQLTASCWSPRAAGGSSLVLSALWGTVTGARTPFPPHSFRVCEHETCSAAPGVLLKWWHGRERGIWALMSPYGEKQVALYRSLMSKGSKVCTSFMSIQPNSQQSLFVKNSSLEKLKEMSTCQLMFITSNSKNALDGWLWKTHYRCSYANVLRVVNCSNLLSKGEKKSLQMPEIIEWKHEATVKTLHRADLGFLPPVRMNNAPNL